MSDSDDPEYDQEAHERLLKSVRAIGGTNITPRRVTVKKKVKKISASELIGAIHSTRNLDDVRKEIQKKKNADTKGKVATLPTPLHRLATERIRSSVAYTKAKKDFAVWAPVVRENRLADHLVFPIEKNEAVDQSGTERLQSFKPRTSLELEMADILGGSKNTLPNEKSYTDAEMELLKAMSLEEAKAKCGQLQKMRALVSYREAKLRRQAKIKSKSYHRHLKRQKRKQLIKEFDELLAKDPEASKEKLAEIERQRILERATLKHRNGSKRMQLLARHASKDTNAKRALEEQIGLGRELVEKHGMENSSDSDSDGAQLDTENALNPQLLLEKAAEISAQEETIETSESNPALKVSLRQLRQEQKISSEKSAATAQQALAGRHSLRANGDAKQEMEASEEKIWEENPTWDVTRSEVIPPQDPVKDMDTVREPERIEVESSRSTRKRKLGTSGKKKREAEQIRRDKKRSGEAHDVEEPDGKGFDDDIDEVMAAAAVNKAKKEAEEEEPSSAQEIDILLDPRHFLKAETSTITQVSADLMEKIDDFDANVEQEALVAAAFEDDDVIGEFEAEKAVVEKQEKPKDIDLTLQGWGSWTGPGIAPKKKDRFIIKAKEKKRKDQGRNGLIISEAIDSSIDKVQPHSAGRIIKPLDKEVTLEEHAKEY